LLRGNALTGDAEQEAEIDFSALASLQLTLVLGGTYGACMGLFSLSAGQAGAWIQLLASAIKLPLLFLATLLVTFPALYVFSVLAGSRLRFTPLLRLILVSILVMVAVSASLAPILAFFTLSTTSYSFMVLLNVVLLGLAGLIGLRFLKRTLSLLLPASERKQSQGTPPPGAGSLFPSAGAPDFAATRAATSTFRVWLVLFALVGVQMAWLLRPFIGRPGAPFTWLRPREASFFQSVFEHLLRFLAG
jgi:hypothetical protein